MKPTTQADDPQFETMVQNRIIRRYAKAYTHAFSEFCSIRAAIQAADWMWFDKLVQRGFLESACHWATLAADLHDDITLVTGFEVSL